MKEMKQYRALYEQVAAVNLGAYERRGVEEWLLRLWQHSLVLMHIHRTMRTEQYMRCLQQDDSAIPYRRAHPADVAHAQAASSRCSRRAVCVREV